MAYKTQPTHGDEMTTQTTDRFMQGFMACLSIVSEHGREVHSVTREAFGSIGAPTNKELKSAGVDDFDIETANAIRDTM